VRPPVLVAGCIRIRSLLCSGVLETSRKISRISRDNNTLNFLI
jgi:hypothetical protein